MQTDILPHLRDLAREAQSYQLERGWSDAEICRRIAHLGSTKTYKRILDAEDDLSELNLDKQTKNYSEAAEYIRGQRSKDKLAEPEYDDFQNIVESRAALVRALDEDTVARFVCIEGESSTGKDAVKNYLLRKWPKITVAVDANTFWETSFNVPTRDIYRALDIRRRAENGTAEPMPNYPQDRAETIRDELQKRKLILLVNEGHHCGRRTLDFLKMLINDTPTVLVLLCIPSLLRKLIREEFETCQQLFSNRLCQRIQLSTPPSDEIGMMLERRGVRWDDKSTSNDAAVSLAAEAPTLGNWRFVVNVVRDLAIESRRKPVDMPRFKAIRDIVKSRRVTRHQSVGRAA